MSIKFKSTIGALIFLLPLSIWMLGWHLWLHRVPSSATPGTQFLASLGIEPIAKKPAPNFGLKDINGRTIRLRDFKGKVVLVNFWATWCPSCRFEMPSMEALHRNLSAHGLVVLALALREGASEVRPFYREHNLSFSALLDQDGAASEQYDVWSLPTTFVIDKQGYVIGKAIGYRDWNSQRGKDLFLHLLKSST